jgi:hypothetical protein
MFYALMAPIGKGDEDNVRVYAKKIFFPLQNG